MAGSPSAPARSAQRGNLPTTSPHWISSGTGSGTGSRAARQDKSTMPGSSVGSLLGRSRVFQESSHVQQSILYSLGKLGGVRLFTAVEGRDGDVDVLIHGIVTHSVAIWHHWTEAHHTVCLGANLDTETGKMRARKHILTTNNYLLSNNRLLIFLGYRCTWLVERLKC